MPIATSVPIRFTPKGLVDAFDSTDVFPGACRSLANLVFDPSNPEIVIARPGVGDPFTIFAPFTSPGFISLQATIGTRVYGMIATGLTAGKDQPFCWDIPTQAFVAVTGCTGGNAEGRPTSPATSGAWLPPSMAAIGTKLIITHPGYSGAGTNFIGVIDISNPAIPVYTTVNLATNPLPKVPTWVANFNNRAYYLIGNRLFYSDPLVPTTATNAGQVLTVGDAGDLIALSGLPIQTATAGIVSALLAFKGSQVWQIVGDAAVAGSLAQNFMSLTVGTLSARSVVSTPQGVYFAGPDALYSVAPTGQIAPVSAQAGGSPDLRQLFGFSSEPSRAAAAFAGNIYRICLPTVVDGVAGTNDYWFDQRKMRWNGPHSFNYDCASGAGTYFILSGTGAGAALFNSTIFPNSASLYTDNQATYNVDMKSADLPKHDEMAEKQVIETTVELSSAGAPVTYAIQAFGEDGNVIGAASVITPQSGGIWGTHNWGDSTNWKSSKNKLLTYPVPWSAPLVFNKVSYEISAVASTNVAIGTLYARTQKTGRTL